MKFRQYNNINTQYKEHKTETKKNTQLKLFIIIMVMLDLLHDLYNVDGLCTLFILIIKIAYQFSRRFV